ncbi:SET domain-containing protein [Aspergillus steynii IBT 23096]|uniref:SET domain-containing protein n=1 Tax=Aspergillus steynii IBT 23096 TaxID=1392250 RepID=A0A2I2GP81_9EURO|nr:SET domain-containing protein [Aspergillus steynii IBT 23096]PLB54686.1 SET domain-containing protein [Aspergillus steynii IBT 23096]
MECSSISSGIISQLCDILQNREFLPQLVSALEESKRRQNNGRLFLQVKASLCTVPSAVSPDGSLILGCVDLSDGQLVPLAQLNSIPTPDPEDQSRDGGVIPLTPQSSIDEACTRSPKRRKTVSGLRLAPFKSMVSHDGVDSEIHAQDAPGNSVSDSQTHSIRQVHSDTGFPQRKKPGRDNAAPVMEPTSTDKLISGIWRQVFSPVQLSRLPSVIEPSINIRTGVSGDVFRAVNTLCLKYYNQSQSSRALEMIVQAYWIECYEARIAVIRLQNPNFSITEARMIALKEACAVLNWKDKDLRNRIAIWRGYKDIKDAGGWASLIFASAGVYRFCKYRTGFGEGFSTRLRHIRCSLEVAADTLHPEWRDLLQVIDQGEARRYHGHPHEWVTVTGAPAVPLASTYAHLDLPHGFQYRFIDECAIDAAAFTDDPRHMPSLDPETCPVCKQRQSDEIEKNQCACFPSLFGGIRGPVPMQLFHTTSGKNNGVVARTTIERGTAIGEFIGLVTSGICGVDVMQGGSHKTRTYQIYQGQMGNFTRFINHSCRPNSQFQRFYWRGAERIVVVSRGVVAGQEITVDYSNHYWNQLDKKCLCGEGCCRFGGR